MGGRQGGEVAARAVVEVLPAELHELLAQIEDVCDPAAATRIGGAIAEFSRRLGQESSRQRSLAGMGATIVLLLVRGVHALVLHMGNSRAYLLRAGALRGITRDHTIVQTRLDGGEISATEAAEHPARNQLTRFVGMSAEPIPDTEVIELEAGDRLFLCTDGLSGALSADELAMLLTDAESAEAACRSLIEAANAAGGKDNITALVVDVGCR